MFNDNTDTAINGMATTWGTNLVLGYRDALTLNQVIDGDYYARLGPDSVVRIPRVARAGQRIIVLVHADTGGFGFFRLIPNNTGFTQIGTGTPSSWGGASNPEGLTGTTSPAGSVTFGLTAGGDLYIENRLAGTYTFRLTIQ